MTPSPDDQKNAEYLRLALPLMARQGVAVTPKNYAVWYEYVRGENPRLKREIDRLTRSGAPFTEETNEQLFKRFVAECDLDQFAHIRDEMASVLRQVGDSLDNAGSEAEEYGGRLGGYARTIEQCRDLGDIRDMLRALVAETRGMRESAAALKAHFDEKSREIATLQEELERERRRATTDPLTGLPNREALFDAITSCVQDGALRSPPSLLMIDIDHFKRINDSFGHLIGDRVIRFVSRVLRDNTKGQDTPARFGGEEFAVLLPNTPAAGAHAVAEQIRRSVSGAKLVRGETREPLGQITVSVGLALHRTGEDVMEFIDRADQALYASKEAGRNRVTGEGVVQPAASRAGCAGSR